MFAQAQLAQLAQLGMGALPTATPGLPVGTPAVQGGGELPTNQPIAGRIKAWYEDKGFGFISPDMGGPDVFVHRNQLSDGQALVQGSPVSFQCRLNPTRGKYEVTACSAGAASGGPAPAAVAGAAPMFAGAPGGGLPMVQDNLFIAGLPLQTNEEFIRSFFTKWGTVVQCKILPDQPGKPDKAALVRFSDENAAKWLVDNLHGKTPEGLASPLTIRHAIGAPKNSGLGGYGLAPAPALGDSRFSPYGAAGLPASAAAAAAPAAAASQLTNVVAALNQLLPGLTQNPQLLQSLQGLSAQNPSLLQGGLQGLVGGAGLAGIAGLGGLAAGGAPSAAAPVDLNAQAAAAAAALTSATAPAAEGATAPGFLGTAPAALPAITAAPQAATLSPDSLAGGTAAAGAPAALPAVADASATAPVATAATTGADAALVTPAPVPVPAPAPAAGGDWLEAKDPASGRPYYYHSVTREVRWDKPA